MTSPANAPCPATTALFDLKTDPLEKNDQAKESPKIVERLKAKLAGN